MLPDFLISINIWGILLTLIGIFIVYWLFHQALHFWYHYRGDYFIAGMTWTLLEVEVPRENDKTPLAMELILSNALYQASTKGMWEKYVDGAVRFWSVLEMTSTEGRIRFFIRCASRTAGLVETQIYAQFPQAKVREIPDEEDYVWGVGDINKDSDWNAWGCEFKLEKNDPYPIKTYVKYGLDKPATKEEHKVDPLTPTIELFGTMGKGEHMWMQIFVRASMKEYGHGHHGHNFTDECQAELDLLSKPYTREHLKPDGSGVTLEPRVPDFLKTKFEGIKGKSGKLPFDCGIRVIYAAKKEAFRNEGRRALRTIFRQYADPDLNAFSRVHSTQFDYPWQDLTGNKLWRKKKMMIDRYRTRSFFNLPFYMQWHYPWLLDFFIPVYPPEIFVLNAEELATIFHFPGMVSETPTFKRIESKVAKPPQNLPI